MTVISKHQGGNKKQRRCADALKEINRLIPRQPEIKECLRFIHPLDIQRLELLLGDAEEAWSIGQDLNPRQYDWSLQALGIAP